MNLDMTFEFDGIQFNYLSHLEENLFDQPNSVFKWGNKSYENEFGQRISQASSKSRKIKLICFSIEKTLNKNPVPKFQYERNALKAFSRRIENNMIKEKEYEKLRNQQPARKLMKRECDKVRDQQPERKLMKRECDKVRDQQSERKQMHANKRIEKAMLIIHTDTGFNLKCCCCEEYKGLGTCVPIEKISQEDQENYLILNEMTLSKDGIYYVCIQCKTKIKSKKMLKIDERPRFYVEDIPFSFQERLKRACQRKDYILNDTKRFGESLLSRRHIYPNRLEAFILKIIIPFLRVSHCPRSQYFLVSADTNCNKLSMA